MMTAHHQKGSIFTPSSQIVQNRNKNHTPPKLYAFLRRQNYSHSLDFILSWISRDTVLHAVTCFFFLLSTPRGY